MNNEFYIPQDAFETHLSALRDLFQEQLNKTPSVVAPEHNWGLVYITPRKELIWREFRRTHWKTCKNNGNWVFNVKSTGVGDLVIASCPICGEYVNLTDMENW